MSLELPLFSFSKLQRTNKHCYFPATVRRVSKMLPSGRRQRGLDPDAADPYLAAWSQHRAHGQEHHDAQGHQGPPGEQPGAGEAPAPHQGQHRFCVHPRRSC